MQRMMIEKKAIRKDRTRKIIIGLIVGYSLSILLGFIFVLATSLIAANQFLTYWLMILLGVSATPLIIYIFLYGGREEDSSATEGKEDSSAPLSGVLLFSLYFDVVAFGIEGIIIAFLIGDPIWGVISLCCGFVGGILAAMTKSLENIIFLGVLGLSIPGFIVGLVLGGGLAIVALILFISIFVGLLTATR